MALPFQGHGVCKGTHDVHVPDHVPHALHEAPFLEPSPLSDASCVMRGKKVRAVASVQMSLAFAGALTSRATLSRLSPQLLPRVSPLNIAVPAPRMMVQRTLQRKPIAMATAVGAAYTAGRAPVVRISPAACCNLCSQGPYHVLANGSKLMALHPHALHKCACVDMMLTYSWALRCKKLALAWGMGSAAWP